MPNFSKKCPFKIAYKVFVKMSGCICIYQTTGVFRQPWEISFFHSSLAFSILSSSLVVRTGAALPNGRCGAFYVDTSLWHSDRSHDDLDGALIGGGWSGAANGQCAAPPFLPPWFHILQHRDLSIMKSPTDQLARVPWAAHGMSTCVDAADTWQMELLQRDS